MPHWVIQYVPQTLRMFPLLLYSNRYLSTNNKHFYSNTDKGVNCCNFFSRLASDLPSAVVQMRSAVIQLQLSNYNTGGAAVCTCSVNLENTHSHKKKSSEEERVRVSMSECVCVFAANNPAHTMAVMLTDSGYLSHL